MCIRDSQMALAVLPAVCDRIELVLIFLGSILLTVGNFAALGVQYYQYGNRKSQDARWDFSYPAKKSIMGRMSICVIGAAAVVSLIFLFDVVRNGSAITSDIPVSYTHLDVYKRQEWNRPSR